VSFLVRRATAGDSEPIRELFTLTFGRPMTSAEWSWKYPDNPDGWIAFVAERDRRIVGHYGGWPVRTMIGGREEIVVAVGDVATDRSVRHLGGRHNVFRSMADEMFAHLRREGVPFVLGFPNPRALAAGARLLGYRSEFPIREVVYGTERPAGRTGASSDRVEEEYDELWRRVASALETGVVRDRRRMNWRYHARPDRYYRFVTLSSSRPGLAACGVLSVVGEEALVMEAVADSGKDALDLAEALSAQAAAMGARRLVFWQTPVGPLATVAGETRSRPGGVVRDAGLALATVPFDAGRTSEFVRRAALTPGIYDDR
jgi:hypothetical protein